MLVKNKIVIYTALFGNYCGLIEQPKLKNVDFICYTDSTDLVSKCWNIIQVDPPFLGDNTRSNRYYKILPHLHLPRNYSFSVYIDANFLILNDLSDVINMLGNYKLLCFDHNQTKTDKRDCIYDEYEAILEMTKKNGKIKDVREVMQKQINRFKKEGYPEHNGLLSAGVLVRKHFDEELIKVMEAWWNIVKVESKRDQLSFNYVAWKLKFNAFKYLKGDIRTGNPWFYLITHRQKFAFKVWKVRMQRLLNFKKVKF